MFFDDLESLHIPPYINFDCTGCGNCCLQWPVPSTAEDRERIIELGRTLQEHSQGPGDLLSDAQLGWTMPQGQLFRRIDMDVLRNKTNQFQYTMEKRADGRCVFLSNVERCILHEKFGAEAKPGMCQLFPYTFTETPDGFYASVSFASSGALVNHGTALQEQREHLLSRLHLFKKLFPNLKLDWSKTQLVDGVSMRWSQYLLLEKMFLTSLKKVMEETSAATATHALDAGDTAHSAMKTKPLNANSETILADAALSFSRHLRELVPSDVDIERVTTVPATAGSDLLLLKYLYNLYFPDDIFVVEEEPSIRDFLREMIDEPATVSIMYAGHSLDLSAVCAQELPQFDIASVNLLARYLYARVFSKLYFGAGMAHFSLLAGFHHLMLIVALIKLRMKCSAAVGAAADSSSSKSSSSSSSSSSFDFLSVAELVRNLERRLASYQHDNESATVLQVLLESPSRFERLLVLLK